MWNGTVSIARVLVCCRSLEQLNRTRHTTVMFPTEIEASLPPPTASGLADPYRWKRWIILILAIIAMVMMVLYFLRPVLFPVVRQTAELERLLSASPTPLPATGTFVDSLYGTVLFKSGDDVKEMELPSRLVNVVLASTDARTTASVLPGTIPTWSTDGELLFVQSGKRTITGVNFESGDYVATYNLRNDQVERSPNVILPSPGNEVLSVGSLQSAHGSEYLEFFDIAMGTNLGFYDNCAPKGIWVEGMGFVAKCKLGEKYSVVLIQFSATSSQMVPITTQSTALDYVLLEPYDETQVVVQRTQGAVKTIGKLSFTGKFTPLTVAERQALPDASVLLDPVGALTKRIAAETKLPNIQSVQVSSDNIWVAFLSDQTMYVSRLDFKEKPYPLGEATWMLLRPR